MKGAAVAFLLLFVSSISGADPSRFLNFLIYNTAATSTLPLSYKIPAGYFDSIPADQRGAIFNQSRYEAACGRVVEAKELDAYTFQTEEMLASNGINLYDAAVRAIALSLLGRSDVANKYEVDTLLSGKTFQFANTRADAPCKGILAFNQCNDPDQDGACGMCYGGNDGKGGQTVAHDNAYFFRMISDIYAYDGLIDARCPEKKLTWVWNDWRPVTGENVWANILGPLQVAYIRSGNNAANIPDTDAALLLASQILPTLHTMVIPSIGAIAYSPYNTYDSENPALGGSVSTENCASALASLKIFLGILQNKTNSKYSNLIPQIQALINELTAYLKSAYNPSAGYFLQGGQYSNGKFTWNTDPKSSFAVDCQTWVISVLGAPTIDSWFGAGTAWQIWEHTKKIGGYQYDASSDTAQGVGFSQNHNDQVFSGEWTFGAINMLRILANQYSDQTTKTKAIQEAAILRNAIDGYLTSNIALDSKGTRSDVVTYANKRYYIPWGWWANPVPALASTGWAVLVDKNFNPFALGGGYHS